MIVNLKPLSINKAWQGRRFKTQDYKDYEEALLWKLKGQKKIPGWYHIRFDFYIKSYKTSDLSNLIKATEDCIVKAGLVDDDRFCKSMTIEKHNSNRDYFKFVIEGVEDEEKK